ncbi:MAG: hypothetical protein M3Y71_18035 [Actinomycetota bacterium]|nr:hypothetical protein [Actinomycetota bacterium]
MVADVIGAVGVVGAVSAVGAPDLLTPVTDSLGNGGLVRGVHLGGHVRVSSRSSVVRAVSLTLITATLSA